MEPGVEAWYVQEFAVNAAPSVGNANVPAINCSWWSAGAPVAAP
ncbi:hypothetical protein [Streptomyces violascens]